MDTCGAAALTEVPSETPQYSQSFDASPFPSIPDALQAISLTKAGLRRNRHL